MASTATPIVAYSVTQLLLLWLYLGGQSLLATGGPSGGTVNLISVNENDFAKVQSMCLDYYNGYFGYAQKPFYISSVEKGWGFCGRNWLGFLMVVSYTQMFAFFVILFQTVMELFVPGPAPLEWPCCSSLKPRRWAHCRNLGRATNKIFGPAVDSEARAASRTELTSTATTYLTLDEHTPLDAPALETPIYTAPPKPQVQVGDDSTTVEADPEL